MDGGMGIVRRDGRTDPFFDGAASGRLLIKRCTRCELWYAPDESTCSGCGDEDLEWAEAAGTGTLVSWTVTHNRSGESAWLALVELAEGPWLYTRLTAAASRTALREGLPLEAAFVHPAEGEPYLLFRPLEA